jgi:Plasmid pRiA4b ORF-3-like protein
MPEATTHILRVTPADEQSVYRDIEIPSGESLYDLANGIVSAFDFDFDHAFGFYSGLTRRTMMEKDPKYELFADMGEETDALSVKKTRIAAAFPKVGHKMLFLFDYGDEWLFRVEVIGLGKKVARSRYPKILASVGASPQQYPDMDDEEE